MKNKFIAFLFIMFFFLQNNAFANPYFKIEQIGLSVICSNSILSNLNLSYMEDEKVDLAVIALNPYIVNNDNPLIKIPVDNLFLICDNNEFQISSSIVQNFFSDISNSQDINIKNISLKLQNIGQLPAGSYFVPLKFINRSKNDYESEYVFNFTVDENLNITSYNNSSRFNLEENEVFLKNCDIQNKEDIKLDIFANKPWKLYLNTYSYEGDNIEYYFKVKNASGNVENYENEKVMLSPNKKYLIAKGSATLDGIGENNTIPTSIILGYLLTNTQMEFLKEGNFNIPVSYTIEGE